MDGSWWWGGDQRAALTAGGPRCTWGSICAAEAAGQVRCPRCWAAGAVELWCNWRFFLGLMVKKIKLLSE